MVLEACKPKIKVPADLVRAALLVCRQLSSGCVLIQWRDRDRGRGSIEREHTHPAACFCKDTNSIRLGAHP